MTHMEHEDQPKGGFPTSRAGLALLIFLAIAGVLLFTEHRAHTLGALIYLPLILCPLVHFFMHGSHSHGSHGRHDREDKTS